MRLLILVLLLASTSAWAQAKPDVVLKLEPYRKTVALRGSIDGHDGLFLFDTGGGTSLLSPKYGDIVGCKPWGRLSGHQMMGDRLDGQRCDGKTIVLGGKSFAIPVAELIDVTKFLPEGAQPVEGSLAFDIFDGKTVTFDFPGKQLIVESEASAAERTQHAIELPAKLSREIQGRALAMNMGVPTAKGMVWFEIDTGNGGTVLVAAPYAELFGLKPNLDQPQQADFALSKDFRATGMAFAPDRMLLDGNIGMLFLHDKVVTFDLARGRMWIAKPQ